MQVYHLGHSVSVHFVFADDITYEAINTWMRIVFGIRVELR